MKELSESINTFEKNNNGVFKSQKHASELLEGVQSEDQKVIQKFNSSVVNAQPKSDYKDQKMEQFKALKETLEQTQLNNDLIAYIQDKLNLMMIDYNLGFIISLSIQEKQELKDKIDSIEKKKNEQINNSLRVKKEQSNSEIFKERLGKKSFSRSG